MKTEKVFISVIIILMITMQGSFGQSQLAEIDEFILSKMELVHKPGMAICIIKDDSVVWSNNYGFAILEDSLAVTYSTIFNAFSIGVCLGTLAVERSVMPLKSRFAGRITQPLFTFQTLQLICPI